MIFQPPLTNDFLSLSQAASSAKSTPSKVKRKPALARTEPRPPPKGGRSLRVGATTDPGTKPRHKSYLPSSSSSGGANHAATFVPVSYLNEDAGSGGEGRGSDVGSGYASEGELVSSLTISSLLSKLDSVKVGFAFLWR